MAQLRDTIVNGILSIVGSLNLKGNASIEGNLVLNDNLSVKGYNMNDFVVEVGGTYYSGYRKWNSGRLEQWIAHKISTTVAKTWGNLYISAVIASPNYPINFLEDPAVIMSSKGVTDGCWLMQTTTGSKSTPPQFYIVRGDSLTITKDFHIAYYAWGRWK